MRENDEVGVFLILLVSRMFVSSRGLAPLLHLEIDGFAAVLNASEAIPPLDDVHAEPSFGPVTYEEKSGSKPTFQVLTRFETCLSKLKIVT